MKKKIVAITKNHCFPPKNPGPSPCSWFLLPAPWPLGSWMYLSPTWRRSRFSTIGGWLGCCPRWEKNVIMVENHDNIHQIDICQRKWQELSQQYTSWGCCINLTSLVLTHHQTSITKLLKISKAVQPIAWGGFHARGQETSIGERRWVGCTFQTSSSQPSCRCPRGVRGGAGMQIFFCSPTKPGWTKKNGSRMVWGRAVVAVVVGPGLPLTSCPRMQKSSMARSNFSLFLSASLSQPPQRLLFWPPSLELWCTNFRWMDSSPLCS